MDFHKVFTTVYPLLKQHRISVVLSILGLTFLVYGLISSLVSNTHSDSLVFEQENTTTSSETIKTGKIVVDVAGAVVKPGVYSLSGDARIRDSLIAASGLSSDADRDWVAKNLNLAAKLTDGAKVYIPKIGESSKNSISSEVSSQININTASLGQLDTLSGVGPVTAQKIIDNRSYSDINELVSKKVLGSAVFEKIKEKITVY